MSRIGGRLPKLAVEVVVIVGSILLAFGIEAWWEERGERVREQEAIVRLTDEFEAVRTELDRVEAVWRGETVANPTAAVSVPTGLAIAERTLAAMGTTPPGPVVDTMVSAMLSVGTPARLPEGTLNALISSGGLSLLRSDSLRAGLAGWAAFRRTVVEDTEALRDLTSQRIIPWLWEQGIPLRTVDVRTGYHEGLGASPFPYDPVALFSDPYFENLANEKLIMFETNLSRLSEVQEHVTLVLRLLAASRTDP